MLNSGAAFLDNIVTSTWVFEGEGIINEYVGGYSDWLRQSSRRLAPVVSESRPRQDADKKISGNNSVTHKKPSGSVSNAKKLSYNESRELEQLPKQIEALETEKDSLEMDMSQADFYRQDEAVIKQKLQRLDEINNSLTVAYERWEQLENRA